MLNVNTPRQCRGLMPSDGDPAADVRGISSPV